MGLIQRQAYLVRNDQAIAFGARHADKFHQIFLSPDDWMQSLNDLQDANPG